MKTKHLAILADLLLRVETLKATIKDPSELAEAAFHLIDEVIIEVNELFSEYQFPTQEDEIHFFKIVRPQFLSLLFFYNCVYKFESSKPFNCKREIKKYLLEHRIIINSFSTENKEFYKYHKSGNTCFDQIYFVRSKHDIKKCINNVLFIVDDRFCTNHCYLTGKLLANELFSDYLETNLLNLKNHTNAPHSVLTEHAISPQIIWTGSNISFIELVYALHEDKALNNGELTLAQTMELMGSTFSQEPGHYSGSWCGMKTRISPAKYLESLVAKIIKKMNKGDD